MGILILPAESEMPPAKVEVAEPWTVSVPVAVRLARVTSPENRPLPWIERSWEGEVVPRPTRLLVLSQNKPLSPDNVLVPVQNVTCPEDPPPLAVTSPSPVQLPFGIRKHPVESAIPLVNVEVALPCTISVPVAIRSATVVVPAISAPPCIESI